MPPLIGITADSRTVEQPAHRRHAKYLLKTDLVAALVAAGAQAVIVPFCETSAQARNMIDRLDGLLISGGDFDIHPKQYGERRSKRVTNVNEPRTVSERHLLKAALKANRPVLGICGGLQLINVAFGGTLYQDIPTQLSDAIPHVQKSHPTRTAHPIRIERGSRLSTIVGGRELPVNSTHHQSAKMPGKGLTICATSSDGVIEAVEGTGDGFLIAVQWHPEYLYKKRRQGALFKALVTAAKNQVL